MGQDDDGVGAIPSQQQANADALSKLKGELRLDVQKPKRNGNGSHAREPSFDYPEARDWTPVVQTPVVEIQRDTTAPERLKAPVYAWRDPETIPPRPWLYGYHYMRGMVSATAGAGGAGKSTLTIVEILSMVTGLDLLNDRLPLITGPLRVWYHNGEDPLDELQRRFQAACLHYGITQDMIGDRLRLTSGRDNPIVIATATRDGVIVSEPAKLALIAEITLTGTDCMIADPFVATHNVAENDNTGMEQVMRVWRDIAEQTTAAIDLVHHFRKASQGEVSADELRGASAITGACRSVRVIAAMSQDEAIKAGIDPEDRLRYVWCANPKGNMTIASTRKAWRFLESVCLDNAVPPYPADHVGVATAWDYPDLLTTGVNAADIGQFKAIIQQADPLMQCRVAMQSKFWMGHLLAATLEVDMTDPAARQQVRNALRTLERLNVIQRAEVKDPVKRRMVPVYVAGEGE